MYNYDQRVHFIGIGGVGMSSIAEVLVDLGYKVSGSDLRNSAVIQHLQGRGVLVAIGHNTDNIRSDVSVVVYSSAVSFDNPEIIIAKERQIPVVPRAEMLSELMRMKYGIAIAGSHGKTSTTAMVSQLVTGLGLDPTVIIGGRVLSDKSGARVGRGDYLIAEADESDGSFTLLRPAIAIVTNIDSEHLSHYGTFSNLEKAFASFMQSVPFYGLVVYCKDDPILSAIIPSLSRRTLGYGLGPESEIRATAIQPGHGGFSYELNLRGEKVADVNLPIPGLHMVSNSLAAAAVAIELGAYPTEISRLLASYPGVARRSERICCLDGVLVVDDYGHHPTEINATVAAIRQGYFDSHRRENGNQGRLIVLFEPHRYSRTQSLFGDFLKCFHEADQVFIGDIYSAGEDPIPGLTSADLVSAMNHNSVAYRPSLYEFADELVEVLRPGDLVLTLGAGGVTKVSQRLEELLRSRHLSAGQGTRSILPQLATS